jgi:peptidoglycan/xylan/chitin deacetylase (PgdA/CDA1 family)
MKGMWRFMERGSFPGFAAVLWMAAIQGALGADIPIDLSPLPALESATVTPSADQAPLTGIGDDQPFFVLCYHRFLNHPDEDEDLAQAEYQMPLDEFKWQMQYLKDNGFHPISKEQLMGYWFQGKPLPLKPVLITFDDGFRTIYRDAFPVIKAQGYPTILFLYTKFIEYGELALKKVADGAKKHKVILSRQALKDADILSMEKSGMVVESHTANHMNLGKEGEKLDAADAQKLWTFELSQPLTFIETRFNHKPDWLAYPYGVYDPGILKTVEAEGYKLAFTVNPGPNDRTLQPLMLKRNLVLYPISHERFAKIFKDKVLHLKKLSPGDGDLIDSQKPVITAQILDDIVPKSVKLQIGNHVMKVQFDPQTHVFTHSVGDSLPRGGHILTAMATDKDGNNRVYNWYFRIKHQKVGKDSKDEDTHGAAEN